MTAHPHRLPTQPHYLPPRYLPAVALQRIRLVDILRCARHAEDEGQSDNLRSDRAVSELLQTIEQQLDDCVGDKTLAEFLQAMEKQKTDEDSLV